MSYDTSVGVAYYISQTFASAKTLTIVSNANPALATSVGHGYSDNDEVLYEGGWERANNGVFKVDQQSADTFLIKGLNSSSITLYTAGGGLGTTKKISSWIEIPQILGVTPEGGDPRYIDVNPVKLLQGFKLNAGFNPASISWEIGFDSALTDWDTLLDISRNQTAVAYKRVKGTKATYGYGFFSLSEQPQDASGAVVTVRATFSAQGPLISYAT